ncbi:hypothetical protein [Streptomyces sp. NPDC058572]|uniref:hypothetical protein n=1 Tax=Streptomyces sp. NPDC058572 TaxID=3346546 RepID=UPI00364B1926
MAERARYVVVRDGVWQQYYWRWGAPSFGLDILEGPDAFSRFVAGRQEEGPGDWMDDVQCEAAAVVDHDARVLLLFTWHLESWDERSVMFEVLARTWPGWRVRWAYDGLEDIVAHVGVQRELVRSELATRGGQVPFDPADVDEPDFTLAVTVAYRDGTQGHLVAGENVADVLGHGPEVVRQLLPGSRARTAPRIPYGGVHIDVPAREVSAWTYGNFLGGAAAGRPPGWDGWRWTCWFDAYNKQQEASGGAILFPAPLRAAGVRAWLEQLDEHHPPGAPGAEQRRELRDVLTQLSTTLHDSP